MERRQLRQDGGLRLQEVPRGQAHRPPTHTALGGALSRRCVCVCFPASVASGGSFRSLSPPAGWMRFRNKCFLFKGRKDEIRANWSYARGWCRGRGGDLAVIDDRYENGELGCWPSSGRRGNFFFVLNNLKSLVPRLCVELPEGPGAPHLDRPVRPAGGEPVRLERRGQPGALHQLERQGAQQRGRNGQDVVSHVLPSWGGGVCER